MTITIEHAATSDTAELTRLMHELEELAKAQRLRGLVEQACFNAMQAECIAERLRTFCG